MPSVEINTEYQNAQRFPAWMALGIFSTVCLASTTSKFAQNERDGNVKWVLACTILSMLIGIAGFAGYLFARGMFVGQLPEIALTASAIALWAGGLPVIMDPDNKIAVQNITVVNANLYFFSWLSLGAVVFVCGSLAQEQLGMKITDTPANSARWFGLTASSLVVLGTSVRIFLAVPCNDTIPSIEGGPFCKRTKLAISLGVISSALGVFLMYASTKKMINVMQETGLSLFLLILWCFGVGYTTFGESPGSQIGNLYFSSWISFIIVVIQFGNTFREFASARMAAPATQENGATPEETEMPPNNIPTEEDI